MSQTLCGIGNIADSVSVSAAAYGSYVFLQDELEMHQVSKMVSQIIQNQHILVFKHMNTCFQETLMLTNMLHFLSLLHIESYVAVSPASLFDSKGLSGDQKSLSHFNEWRKSRCLKSGRNSWGMFGFGIVVIHVKPFFFRRV